MTDERTTEPGSEGIQRINAMLDAIKGERPDDFILDPNNPSDRVLRWARRLMNSEVSVEQIAEEAEVPFLYVIEAMRVGFAYRLRKAEEQAQERAKDN